MIEMEQFILESTWSTRAADGIIEGVINDGLATDAAIKVYGGIEATEGYKTDIKEVYVKLFGLLLKDKKAKPIQAIATQIGIMAGLKDPMDAFKWGIELIKNCQDADIFTLKREEDEWYVYPNYALDKETKQKLDKLQYLPPMKIKPNKWTNNHDGGWVYENKHLVLGKRFSQHNKPLAYDVVNKLQDIAWCIDTETYLYEKDTNRNMNKKQFLRVINEYLDQPFYFVWRYDSRGRSYSSGYDLNLQSNEYGKGLISLYEKEHIVNTDNLLIAIAGHAGKDKLTWQERIDWASGQNTDDIEWKEPILGRKAVRAYQDAMDNKPSGYVMSIDATSSGLQIMAAMSGCKETAKFTNMVDPDVRYDLYTEVMDRMNAKLSDPVNRKVIKQCVMTRYYNSIATPESLLTEEQLAAFYEVIDGLLPGAEEVMEIINGCWNYAGNSHSWVMPDGHTVYVPVVEGTNVTYEDDQFGDIPLRYYEQTSSENFRSLCPNIVHSIDGYVAREMVRRCEFTLSHIHDCFVFSPDHLQDVTAMYRTIMAEIADSNIFEDILQQITGDKTLKIQKYSDDLSSMILNSSYMLS